MGLAPGAELACATHGPSACLGMVWYKNQRSIIAIEVCHGLVLLIWRGVVWFGVVCCMLYAVLWSEQLMLRICNSSRPQAKLGTLPHIEADAFYQRYI